MSEIPYPLPPELVDTVEHLLSDVSDRGNTVYLLRRHFGKVYALGYQDGRTVARQESWSDREHEERQRAVTTCPGGC